VADVEGGSPDFFDDLDELAVPGEDIASPDGAAEPTAEPASEPVSELLADIGDAEAAQISEPTAEPEKPAEEKKPSKLPLYLELAGAIGIPLLLLVLAWLQVLNFSTALYVIAVGFIPYGIWKDRKTSTVYTVILACALAAVLTAVFCMWLEWGRYQFDVKARGAKQQVRAPQSLQPASLACTGRWAPCSPASPHVQVHS
jgi:hypothetical protein